MQYYLINLKRTPERLEEFCKNNPGFEFTIFDAVDGKTVDRSLLLTNGTITQSIHQRYTDGAIGVAMSHKKLWEICVGLNQPITVIEDDAYLNKNFLDIAERNTKVNDGWDIIYWGCNLDQNIGIEMIPRITMSEIRTDSKLVCQHIDKFRDAEFPVTFYRCAFAIGLVCYSVSPKGAKHLLEHCFPVRDYDRPYLNFGIDHSVLEELPAINGYIVIPPLALTKNDVENSTVQR